MKSLVGGIKGLQHKRIEQHEPAKNAPDASSDVAKFLELYDKWWVESQDRSRAKETDGFHPSWLGAHYGNCARFQVYMLRGAEKKPIDDARVLRIFKNGNDVHDHIQKAIEGMVKKGYVEAFQKEAEVKGIDPPISGHTDGVLVFNGRRIFLEIKSANDMTFSNRRKYKKAKDEHLAQVSMYAYVLGADIIWIMYECKNDQATEIFEYDLDKEAVEKQLAKWRKNYKKFQDGELPDRPYKGPNSKACVYCPMKQECYNMLDEAK